MNGDFPDRKGCMRKIGTFGLVIIITIGFLLAACDESFFGKIQDLRTEAEGPDALAGTVSIDPAGNWCGGTLSARASTPGFNGEITYEWRWTDGNEPIGSGSQYTIRESDLGREIHVRVTRVDAKGYISSAHFQVSMYYPIFSEEDLRAVKNNLDYSYILVHDIELTEVWIPVAPDTYHSFNGIFEGNGRIIRNLSITGDEENRGLFGNVGVGAILQNINLSNVTIISRRNYVGALAGYNYGTVQNCSVTGKVSGGKYTGSLIGNNHGMVTGCQSETEVNGDNYTGGIAGYNFDTITGCYANNTITGNSYVGGVAGSNIGLVQNCHIAGYISGADNIGGIIGDNNNTVKNCDFSGEVAGISEVGGVTGMNCVILRNCIAYGKVSGDMNIGGISGVIKICVMEKCVALNESIAGNSNTGRVTGLNPWETLISNYAGSTIVLNGKIVAADTGPGTLNGESVDPGTGSGQYNNQGFWIGLGFDFSSEGMWAWDSTFNLPVLKMVHNHDLNKRGNHENN